MTPYKSKSGKKSGVTGFITGDDYIVVQFNYSEMNDVMRIMKKYDCSIYKNEMQLFCKIETGIAKFRLAEVLYELKNIRNVECIPAK